MADKKLDIKDFLVDPKDEMSDISLLKLTGNKVKDIRGYITREFGDPVFKLGSIIFEDGKEVSVDGEHDLPYLSYDSEKLKNMDSETMTDLYKQQDGENE